jgi:phosphonate transport system permease protein
MRAFVLFVVLNVLAGAMLWPKSTTVEDVRNGLVFLSEWVPPGSANLATGIKASCVTVATAFLGSSLGIALGLPLSFAGSSRLALFPFSATSIVRCVFVCVRSVPEIVVALILLVVFGPGPFAAALAIGFHNTAIFAKLISERLDEAPAGSFEAILSVGASRTAAAVFGVLPEIWPTVVSQYFYRFEVGVRASIALGLIGAGGIGQQLVNHFKTFQYRDVTTDVIVIMVVIALVDLASVRMQRMYA